MTWSTPFIRELQNYVLAGQSAMYINSVEESRVVAQIRKAGWLLLRDNDLEHRRCPPHEVEEVQEALLAAGEEPGTFVDDHLLVAPTLVRAYETLDKKVPDGEAADYALRAQKKTLRTVLDRAAYTTLCWDLVSGFEDDRTAAESLLDALARVGKDEVSELPQRCLVVFKDAHFYLGTTETPSYRRALRNLYEDKFLVSGKLNRFLIFLQPYLQPHHDIRHCLVRLDFPLPDDGEIDKEIQAAVQGIETPSKRNCPEDLRTELVRALRGMSSASIATTLSKCIVDFGGMVREVIDGQTGQTRRLVPAVRAMRSQQLSSDQGMRIIDPDDPELTLLGDLSGYENVRKLADRVLYCRTRQAKELGLRAPTGFGVAGPTGGGKTHCARLFAHWLGVPLVTMNIGTTKESFVGASEGNMAHNLTTIRALGDCVVLFDEWDKQSGGLIGSFSDGNTSSGMLSLVLDFAADPKRQAFLIFTMNRLHGPVESLRAGRISRFFYTPLPDAEGRLAILRMKLHEHGAKVPQDLRRAAADDLTAGLSGAELTEMVNEAVTLAAIRYGTLRPKYEEFAAARAVITPVTKLNKEEVAAMQDFEGTAVPVGVAKKKKTRFCLREVGVDNN